METEVPGPRIGATRVVKDEQGKQKKVKRMTRRRHGE